MKGIKVELYTDLQSMTFEVTDEEAVAFIRAHLEEGKPFEIFFPDYEISASDEDDNDTQTTQ